MSFQKCPVCNGTGNDPNFHIVIPCSTCRGSKIINTITGLPPRNITMGKDGIPRPNQYEETDFREKGESQQEYFGK